MLDFIRNAPVNRRITINLLLALTGIIVVGLISISSTKDRMLDARKTQVKQLVDVTHSILTFYYNQQQAGRLSQTEAQQAAKEQISTVRYGNNDYFWINDYNAAMVMHPIKPQLDGKDLANFADTSGKKIFSVFASEVEKNGQGFVDYHWAKPGFDDPVAKISYVKGFKPWGWIIGSGLYLDDVDAAFTDSLISLLLNIVVVASIMLTVSIFIAQTILKQLGSDIWDLDFLVRKLTAGQLGQRITAKNGKKVNGIAGQVNELADNLENSMRVISLHSGSITSCAAELVKIRYLVSSDAKKSQSIVTETMEHNKGLGNEIQAITQAITKTSGSISTVSEAAQEVSTSVITIAAGAEEASANIYTMASAAEEITANLGGVNESLEQVDKSVNGVAESIRKMTTSLGEVRELCISASQESTKAKNLADSTSEVMKRLSGSAQEIGEVVEIINNIAEQTNMLAINASIEAAGAGEAGKGFAVVANEVKDLARQTGDATKMIYEKIQGIQKSTLEVAGANTEIGGVIGRINRSNQEISFSIDQQNHTIQNISQAMVGVTEGASEVTRNAAELNMAASEVARAAQEAANGTAEVASTASAVAASAESVANASQEANTQAANIQASMQAVEAVSKEVQIKMEEAGQVAGQSRSSAFLFGQMGKILQGMTGALFAAQVETDSRPPFDMRAFKTTHLKLQSLLEQAISGRIKLTKGDVVGVNDCLLGKWIKNGEGEKLYGNSNLFHDLVKSHEEVHARALSTLEIVNKKGWEGRSEADNELQKFTAARDIVFNRINRLYLGETDQSPIKVFMAWTPTLETSIEFVDRDHKVLVGMVNDLHQALKMEKGSEAIGKILDGLAKYTVEHFAREEAVFAKHNYVNSDKHINEHKKLVATVTKLIAEYQEGEFTVAMDLMTVAKSWLIEHIMHTDMAFVDFMRKHNVR